MIPSKSVSPYLVAPTRFLYWLWVSELKESWCFVNHGFYHLTIKIIEKDNKYCLTFKGPSRDTDGQMTIHTYELSGRPIRWLGELETLLQPLVFCTVCSFLLGYSLKEKTFSLVQETRFWRFEVFSYYYFLCVPYFVLLFCGFKSTLRDHILLLKRFLNWCSLLYRGLWVNLEYVNICWGPW